MADNAPQDDLQKGVAFLTAKNETFQRSARIYRVLGWLVGWGASALAAFSGVAGNLIDGEKHAHVWASFIAAALVAVNQTVKFDVWADAYFRGHILMETALGDHAMGKATQADLVTVWERAQSGLPGNQAPK